MTNAVDPRCGTYAGASAHGAKGEPCCDLCGPAAAAYQREWRARNPDAKRKAAVYGKARNRALVRLSRAHPAEYLDLFNDELVRVENEEGNRG